MKKPPEKALLIVFFALVFFLFPKTALLCAQGIGGTDLDTIRAREEFRIGVQAYYRFSYNEAILSFERALSFRPGEPLILDWLGKAYYRSGIENTAFRAWQAAAAEYGFSSGQGMLISSRMETLRNRRILFPVADDEVRYVESGRFPGKTGDETYYRQPSSVLSLNDGSAWVVAYGSNEILRIDPNGIIRERKRGPLNGFDRPYDLVKGLDGNLYLSELRGQQNFRPLPVGRLAVLHRLQGPGARTICGAPKPCH